MVHLPFFGHLHKRTSISLNSLHPLLILELYSILSTPRQWLCCGQWMCVHDWWVEQYDMIWYDWYKSLSFLSTTALVYVLKVTEQLVHHKVEQNAGSNARWISSGFESINSTTGASLCVENLCDFIGFFFYLNALWVAWVFTRTQEVWGFISPLHYLSQFCQ